MPAIRQTFRSVASSLRALDCGRDPGRPALAARHLARVALAAVALVAVASCGGSTAGKPTEHSQSAAAPPPISAAQGFAVLAGQTVTNTGPSGITGDLGVSPGTAVTGFPPGLVAGGAVHAADAVALQAQAALTVAYDDLAGRACDFTSTGIDLAGRTLVPGIYCFTSSALLSGALVLDAQGSPDAVFIFQIGSTLTTATGASVQVINGGSSCNVFWQVGSSATLGAGTSFAGSILALSSISLGTGADVSGRALARNGAVTLDTNHVSVGACTGCSGATCGGTCVDTATDPANCGGCGLACAAGQTCSAGVCSAVTCTSGKSCGGTCVDTATDPANCGGCGLACAAGQTCSAGVCSAMTCTSGTLCCSACVDTTTDATNCGACGHACAAGETCAAGVCTPPVCTGLVCGGVCMDVWNDPANCGACGNACAIAQQCACGTCAPIGASLKCSLHP